MSFKEQIIDILRQELDVDVRQAGDLSTVIREDGTSQILGASGAAPDGVYSNRLLDELIRAVQNGAFGRVRSSVVMAHLGQREPCDFTQLRLKCCQAPLIC